MKKTTMRYLPMIVAIMFLASFLAAHGEGLERYGIPGTPEAMTKGEIIDSLGIINRDNAEYYSDFSSKREGDCLKLHVCFVDGVYEGGTEGYDEEWIHGMGILSDLEYDLDGDGEDELVLICCKEDELLLPYLHMQGYILIYEPEGRGYIQTAIIPIDIGTFGTCARGIRLIEHDGHRQLVFISNSTIDAGGGSITIQVYEYDGANAWLMLSANAGINLLSYAAFGPFDIAWGDLLYAADLPFSASISAEDLGLREGENYHAIPDLVNLYDGNIIVDGIYYTTPQAFDGFNEIAEIVRDYGIEIDHELLIWHFDQNSGHEEYNLIERDDGTTLLWLEEGIDSHSAYIDITLHTSLNHGE